MATATEGPAPPGVAAAGTKDATITVRDPVTGEAVAAVPDMSAAEVRALVDRAAAARPAWQAVGFAKRARRLRDLRRWVGRNSDRLVDLLCRETGQTYEDALAAEILFLCQALGYWARNAGTFLKDERVRPKTPALIGRRVLVRWEPHGVVGVIAPWNHPLTLGIGDAIPALAAGNAVILKPSEFAPLAVRTVVEEGMREAGIPQDACLVATGAGETGAALVDYADMVMFTGSTATGTAVLGRAAQRLIPATAELGGKDPMIVLADADLDRAADCAMAGGLSHSGQICMSVERIYVEAPVYDEFVATLVGKVRTLRQNPGRTPGSADVGAMTTPFQVEKVEAHVRDAVERGAKVLCGGQRRDGSSFFEPTVLVDVDHSMACMREETFGPTLPVMRVTNAEEAVRLANDTPYGLNSSVFTRDLARGEAVARQIEAGNCTVNDPYLNFLALDAPFGGWKASGIGQRHGAAGIRKYCKPQTVMVNRRPLKRDPLMYPTTAGKTKVLRRLIRLAYARRLR